ncbi:MAG: hypothetical protein IJ125_05150 [Atopobiaceae bacterium]|nr:hypothetical protein [Atopobiaceae bacterium]
MAKKKTEEHKSTEAEEMSMSLEEAVESLAGANRRRRQEASRVVAQQALDDPKPLADYAEQLIDALFRPEAQTRWEVLDALTCMCQAQVADVSSAAEGAEAALFDENAAVVRLAAFRLLAALGAQSPAASDEHWPLLNEAIQCYHGDTEYREMLVALVDFAQGDISSETRDALVERMSFDADNGRGYIRSLSRDVLTAAGVKVS